jgi:hypothetical protein
VAEGGGLLNRYTAITRIVGSNPIPSATQPKKANNHNRIITKRGVYPMLYPQIIGGLGHNGCRCEQYGMARCRVVRLGSEPGSPLAAGRDAGGGMGMGGTPSRPPGGYVAPEGYLHSQNVLLKRLWFGNMYAFTSFARIWLHFNGVAL